MMVSVRETVCPGRASTPNNKIVVRFTAATG